MAGPEGLRQPEGVREYFRIRCVNVRNEVSHALVDRKQAKESRETGDARGAEWQEGQAQERLAATEALLDGLLLEYRKNSVLQNEAIGETLWRAYESYGRTQKPLEDFEGSLVQRHHARTEWLRSKFEEELNLEETES